MEHRLTTGAAALVFAFATASGAFADTSCPRADASFGAFLARFRSDREFQLGRVTIPLRYRERGPGEASTTLLSFGEVKARWRTGFLASVSPKRDEQDEAAVCEKPPQVGGTGASLVQFSCHTDLFENTFHFAARRGCWFLDEVRSAGG